MGSCTTTPQNDTTDDTKENKQEKDERHQDEQDDGYIDDKYDSTDDAKENSEHQQDKQNYVDKYDSTNDAKENTADNKYDGIDVAIFKDKTSPSCNGNINGDYNNCISIKRLSLSLLHYQNNAQLFINCMIDVYQYQVLNDFHHLLKNHSNEIQDIYQYLIKEQGVKTCPVKRCEFASRHHRGNTDKEDISSSISLTVMFYKEVLDSLHVQLFHLYEYGLRTLKRSDGDGDDEKIEKEEEVNNTDKYFDAEFNKISKIISERRESTKSFDRFKSNNCKYNITVNNKDEVSDNKEGETYLDVIYSGLWLNGINSDCILRLCKFVECEEYDSDSLILDIDICDLSGNIAKHVNNTKCINQLICIIKNSRRMLFN